MGSCAVHHRFNLHSKYCRVFMILVHMLRMSYDNNFMNGRNYKIYNITTCHCCKIYDLRYIRSLIYSQHVALKDLWHKLNNVWLPHSYSNTTINNSSQWWEQYQTKKNPISTIRDSNDQVRPHRMSPRPKVILWPCPWLSSLSRDGLPRLDPTVVFLFRLIARNTRFLSTLHALDQVCFKYN